MSQSANPADDARVVGGGGGGGSDRSFDADEIPDGGGASEDGDVVDHVGSETGSEGDGDEEGDEEGDGDGSDDDAGPSGGGCVASRLRSRSNSVSVSEDRGTQSLEFNPPGYMRPTRAKASNRGGGGWVRSLQGDPPPPRVRHRPLGRHRAQKGAAEGWLAGAMDADQLDVGRRTREGRLQPSRLTYRFQLDAVATERESHRSTRGWQNRPQLRQLKAENPDANERRI